MRTSSEGFLPRFTTSAKLFVTGATVGPLVDSIHNQSLLQYDLFPLTISAPASVTANDAAAVTAEAHPLLCSSWLIPPLLGFAYVILGGVLPRIMQVLAVQPLSGFFSETKSDRTPSQSKLRTRAYVAVITTALIIKLSDLLVTHQLIVPGGDGPPDPQLSIAIMLGISLSQWLLLDGTWAALLAAAVTAFGGPLSELPFVAAGCWHYIPSAADYVPLAPGFEDGGMLDTIVTFLLGENYSELALSSITGPCYLAVTNDSIALGRWFDAQSGDAQRE